MESATTWSSPDVCGNDVTDERNNFERFLWKQLNTATFGNFTRGKLTEKAQTLDVDFIGILRYLITILHFIEIQF